MDPWITAKDAARLYSVSVGTIYAWASQDGWLRHGTRPKRYCWHDVQNSYEKRHGTHVAQVPEVQAR